MNSSSPTTSPFSRPPRTTETPENRGSMLRASILESALELGLGTNRMVANWMFNPVDEGVEEEENEAILSPGLTYSSTATSEESTLSAGHAQHYPQPGAGILINGKGTQAGLDTSVQYSKRNGLVPPAGPTPEPAQRGLHFDLRATPEPRLISPAPSPQPPSPAKNKLRKARPGGYESDGGYMSESGKAKKEKEKEKKEKEKKEKKNSKKKGKDKDGEGGGAATDYESDGGHLSEASTKKKKGKKEKEQEKKEKEQEKKEKEREKKEKNKSKNTESPTTDYETDKGYSSSFSRGWSRKQSVTSHASGEESDGGYLSESSKKKRFFRMNSKSRKKQDSLDSPEEHPPPVPALPSLSLSIYEKFSRSNTPVGPDSRNESPTHGGHSLDVRPSVETFTSMGTTASADTTATANSSSTTVESDERRESLLSSDGLTRAFADAESVRSPSIDFLSAFRRPHHGGGGSLSPSKFNPFSHGERPSSPLSPSNTSPPALSPSKSVRSRPKISAPNTTNLAPKHVPVPLTLTPPTPTSSQAPKRIPPSPDPDYVLVTPNPSTPVPSAVEQQFIQGAGSAGAPPPSPTMQRPHVLAYYDLPPPSPPPRGPLPDVPSDISRSTSPSWSIMDSPSRFSRSAPVDTTDPRGLQQRPLASPAERPNTAAHPLSKEIHISHDVPTIAQPVPPALRGRVSPFPTAPVLPREQTTTLMRQTSKRSRDAVNRALNHNAPASASPYVNGHTRWPSPERTGVVAIPSGPVSAQPYPGRDSRWPTREQLGVQWQPRSASAMDTQRPYDVGVEPVSAPGAIIVTKPADGGHSWLDYGDDEDRGSDFSDQSLSLPHTRAASAEPPEPSPDVNAILAGFRAQRDAEAAARKARDRATKVGVASARDTLAGIVEGYGRDTVYLDADEGDGGVGGDRASVWSDANSRYSFLDNETSAQIRAKFVKRVEAMYGEDVVPPVPRLGPGLGPEKRVI